MVFIMTFENFIKEKYSFNELEFAAIKEKHKVVFEDVEQYLQAEAEKIKVETEMKDFKFRQSLQPLNTDEGDE